MVKLIVLIVCILVAVLPCQAAEFDANADGVFDAAYKVKVDNLVHTATTAISSNVITLLSQADFAGMRTQLSLVPGTNVQAYDADLNTIAGLTAVENKVMIGSSAPAWSVSAWTIAAPGAAGGILYSDGNNWTRVTTLPGSFDIGTVGSAAGQAAVLDGDAILTTSFTALLPDAASGATLGNALYPWGFAHLGNANTSAGGIYFYEDTDNGTNAVLLQGPASTSDVTVVLPAAAGTLALNDQTMYIGTTQVAINRGSAALTLAGITLTTPDIGAATGTSLALGADPADTGTIRLPNAGYIYSEADAAGTDISVIGVDSGEIVQIAASGASGVTITPDTTITGDLTISGSDLTLGAAGVKLTGDGDGAITFLGLGNGYDENLTLNFDDTENTVVVSSSTGVTSLNFSGLNLVTTGQISGSVPVVTKNADGANTFSGEEFRGAMVLLGHADAISDITLPDYDAAGSAAHAKIGDTICFYAFSAYAHTIHPESDDKIRTSNGTLNGAGAGVTYTTASTPVAGMSALC
jgi:hypothetical protein